MNENEIELLKMGYEANEKGIDFETLKETAENITGEQA